MDDGSYVVREKTKINLFQGGGELGEPPTGTA